MKKPEIITIGESMVVFNPILNTSFNDSHLFTKQIGGAESNYAIGLSRLGHNVGWIGRLSDDSFGYYVNNVIRGNGVDTSLVEFDKHYPTGLLIKEKMIKNNVNVHYYRENSAASKMSPAILDEGYFSQAKYLFISGITPILSDSCKDTIIEAIAIAKRYDVKVIFDPNIRYKLIKDKDQYKSLLNEIILQSDIFLPGLKEAKFLCGKQSPEEISEVYINKNPNIKVVIKLGDAGCFYADKREEHYVPGYEVDEIIDPIGAGDGFAAGLTSGLLDGKTMLEALDLANLIGSIIIQTSGDVEGFPFRYQVEELKEIQDNPEIEEVKR